MQCWHSDAYSSSRWWYNRVFLDRTKPDLVGIGGSDSDTNDHQHVFINSQRTGLQPCHSLHHSGHRNSCTNCLGKQ